MAKTYIYKRTKLRTISIALILAIIFLLSSYIGLHFNFEIGAILILSLAVSLFILYQGSKKHKIILDENNFMLYGQSINYSNIIYIRFESTRTILNVSKKDCSDNEKVILRKENFASESDWADFNKNIELIKNNKL